MKLSRRRHGPAVARGRLWVGRSEKAGRQLAVLVGAGWRPAGVDVVKYAEQRLEVGVAVTADVNDLVAVLFGPYTALRHQSGMVHVLLLLL